MGRFATRCTSRFFLECLSRRYACGRGVAGSKINLWKKTKESEEARRRETSRDVESRRLPANRFGWARSGCDAEREWRQGYQVPIVQRCREKIHVGDGHATQRLKESTGGAALFDLVVSLSETSWAIYACSRLLVREAPGTRLDDSVSGRGYEFMLSIPRRTLGLCRACRC